MSTGIVVLSMQAGEGLRGVHVQTSRPSRCLTDVARAEGGGEGAEARLGEGLGSLLHLHHNHHSPRLLLHFENGEIIERPLGPSLISGRQSHMLKEENEQIMASVKDSAKCVVLNEHTMPLPVALLLMRSKISSVKKLMALSCEIGEKKKLVKHVDELGLPVDQDQ